jgi:hypothetical protein
MTWCPAVYKMVKCHNCGKWIEVDFCHEISYPYKCMVCRGIELKLEVEND